MNLGSSGFTTRSSALVGRGEGAISTKQSSNSCTPKLFKAEPKKTGAVSAALYEALSKVGYTSFTSSRSSRNLEASLSPT